jgi:subtilisin family serine protease
MRFRLLSVLPVLVVAGCVLAVTGAAAKTPAPAPVAEESLTRAWTPLGVGKSAVTLVVELEGAPVAVEQAKAGRKLSKEEKAAIRAQLKERQDALKPRLTAAGATVVADFQSAYNGIKVRVDPRRADELAALPGVVAVHVVRPMERTNSRGVQLIGAPTVWNGPSGLRGEGIKIAIVDTGVDYTHATFGGPGTVAAYQAADAADTIAPPPTLMGPLAPRVKGGIDLVGDAYNASADAGSPALTPHPDPNPLDCNGHGTHVAGTAAGSGVLADGSWYNGPYTPTTITGNSWLVGPGVAPKADIYAVRVFGCAGSTDVTVDAIDWAVENDMDVINMSLGSPFGTGDDPSAKASTNAAKAGVIVVASAGNSGAGRYITGSPSTGAGALAVAAIDPVPDFPGVRISAGGLEIDAINANGHPFNGPLTGSLKVIRDNPATAEDESLGCSVASFGGPLPAGTIAVVNRGVCARVAKAIFGQQAGAAAVVMVNNTASLPPYEGPITSNPDDGTPFTVTIPFLGVRGPASNPASDGARLRALPDGTSVTLTPTNLQNPGYLGFASFTSGGPRSGDSTLKPDISAPGVSITSALVGSGNQPLTISGTSMAAPHVAGVAVLTKQAHPDWNVEELKAAIVNTADPSMLRSFTINRGGTGLVQPVGSTRTQVVATTNEQFGVALDFGFEELKADYSKSDTIQLRNNSDTEITFDVATEAAQGAPHTVALSDTTVTVPAHGAANVRLTLTVPAATAGSGSDFSDVAGYVRFAPAAGDNNGITLRIAYYMVPRALSDIRAQAKKHVKAKKGEDEVTVELSNRNGVITGAADFYAWGLADKRDKGKVSNDIRAVGVQSFPSPSTAVPTRRLVVFAVNTYDKWSNASTNEFDIYVDVDNDGTSDYVIVAVDFGAVTAGSFSGSMGAFVFSLRSGRSTIAFFADAPTDSSTVLIPVLSTALCMSGEPCLSSTNPRFSYSAASFDLWNGGVDEVEGTARYNPWTPAIETGDYAEVPPGGTATVTVTINRAEWALTPALGLMVVALDNKSGPDEAELIELKVR